ncbi:putative membrane protein [Marmoricola sp. URHA0025 HA25]
MATQSKQGGGATDGLLAELPVDRLKDEVLELGKALAKRGVTKLGESLTGATDKLGDLGDAVPGPTDLVKAATIAPVKGAASKVKDALPGSSGSDEPDAPDVSGESGGKRKGGSVDGTNLKVTNIVETIDVPVGRDVAYQLWTQFEDFPSFMKKVESVKQKDPEVVTWKAQVFWSHRTWTAKILDQVPPERIVWKSQGQKGHVDGAVTFHELAPDLTRVLVSLEYFPQGLFERTANLWRAQGRRVRLELRHYRRYVANHAILQQDDVDGWEGEIHDGKVKRRRSSSTAKKSASNGSTAKKSASSGSTGKKSASSGSTAKKSSSSGSSARKSTSSGSAAKKSTTSRPAAKKSSSSRPAAKKSTSGRSTAKKTAAARKSPAKKTASGSASKRTSAAAKRSSTTSKRTSRTSRSKS